MYALFLWISFFITLKTVVCALHKAVHGSSGSTGCFVDEKHHVRQNRLCPQFPPLQDHSFSTAPDTHPYWGIEPAAAELR
ncbi:hypothetical protein [Thauera sp. SDU_THAU2]|uniref:hypothetical protein n=1 Tax=Thauera sp. SDU_THAU2 TaxID=3136633 RepID=UPI00311F2C9E